MARPFGILTTDLHLTENPNDDYRFGIFKWILENHVGGRCCLFITGDLTDKKDNHSGWFVNKIVTWLKILSEHLDIYLLKGNHDFTDPNSPFFQFLGKMECIHYFTTPLKIFPTYNDRQYRLVMLPNTRNPLKTWKGLELVKSDAIFMHQTFKGALAESGIALDGPSSKPFEKYKAKIFSGDIHVPQQIGPVVYTGAPYHVHFGDKFEPRVLLLDENFNYKAVQYPAPRKYMADIRSPSELKSMEKLRKGDWIKVRVQLPRSEFVDWPKHRDSTKVMCERLGLRVFGVKLQELRRSHLPRTETKGETTSVSTKKPKEVFLEYCRVRGIDQHTSEIGLELLKGS